MAAPSSSSGTSGGLLHCSSILRATAKPHTLLKHLDSPLASLLAPDALQEPAKHHRVCARVCSCSGW